MKTYRNNMTDLLWVAVDVEFEHVESIVFAVTVLIESDATSDTVDVNL